MTDAIFVPGTEDDDVTILLREERKDQFVDNHTELMPNPQLKYLKLYRLRQKFIVEDTTDVLSQYALFDAEDIAIGVSYRAILSLINKTVESVRLIPASQA